MNARDYKSFRSNNYYHIYNRGNNKEDIFKEECDYLNFLKRLTMSLGVNDQLAQSFQRGSLVLSEKRPLRINPLPTNAFTILAYCLMPNHFHLLIKQNSDLGIDRLMAKVCSSYAWYFNKKYSRVGNVFQDHFKAKLVENDTYLTYLSAYIHNNPSNPVAYPFSSLPTYIGLNNNKLCDTSIILKYFKNSRNKYKTFVSNFSKNQQINLNSVTFKE